MAENHSQVHTQPPVFSELSIVVVPSNKWVPAVARFGRDASGRFIEFKPSADSTESFNIKTYVHHSQVRLFFATLHFT
jgi:hypothetical protein